MVRALNGLGTKGLKLGYPEAFTVVKIFRFNEFVYYVENLDLLSYLSIGNMTHYGAGIHLFTGLFKQTATAV